MFQAVAWVRRGLFHFRAGLSVRMNSTAIDRKGVLANRVAVITGSTEGIGFAIARRLAQDGAHVVISSRKQQNVDRAVAALQGEGLSVTGTVCHVGKAEDRERLVATVLEHYGGLDFLVCNAGVNPLVGSTLKASEEVWDKILSVNVKSPVAGWGVGTDGESLGPYNISKTAILGLTRTLSLELAPKGIRVNCLVPGIIKTNFSKSALSLLAAESEIPDMCSVLCRLGQPEDCAGIVSFLCSPDASYITGENIVVGGFSSRL
uniref:Dehydrogenase/reductase SDR family member 2, mitochondrial-like n=1 Tax=Ursus maritimus TaxID=29073 RepID=A0A452UK78_URSMA